MKQYTRQELKNYLLKELKLCPEDEEEKQYFEKVIDVLIVELYDTSKNELDILNAKETFILRKLLGVFDDGILQNQAKVAETLNVTSSYISTVKLKMFRQLSINLRTRKIISNNETTTILLSDPIQKLNLPIKYFLELHRSGIKTISELISMNIIDLLEKGNISEQTIDEIQTNLQQSGLSFLDYDKFKGMSIDNLDLSVRAWNCLIRGGIRTIPQLTSMNTNDLLKIRNMCQKVIDEIQTKLQQSGLSLRDYELESSFNIETLSEEQKKILQMDIADLDLSVRAFNCLIRRGIRTISQLTSMSTNDLLKIRNISLKVVDEIQDKLKILGLSLSNDNEKMKQEPISAIDSKKGVNPDDLIRYKELVLEKKQLNKRLGIIDVEIASLLQRAVNQNAIGEENGQSRK